MYSLLSIFLSFWFSHLAEESLRQPGMITTFHIFLVFLYCLFLHFALIYLEFMSLFCTGPGKSLSDTRPRADGQWPLCLSVYFFHGCEMPLLSHREFLRVCGPFSRAQLYLWSTCCFPRDTVSP